MFNRMNFMYSSHLSKSRSFYRKFINSNDFNIMHQITTLYWNYVVYSIQIVSHNSRWEKFSIKKKKVLFQFVLLKTYITTWIHHLRIRDFFFCTYSLNTKKSRARCTMHTNYHQHIILTDLCCSIHHIISYHHHHIDNEQQLNKMFSTLQEIKFNQAKRAIYIFLVLIISAEEPKILCRLCYISRKIQKGMFKFLALNLNWYVLYLFNEPL